MKSENLKNKWKDPVYREMMSKAHLGQNAWNKGKKTGIVPKTAFKKGHKSSKVWYDKMHSIKGENHPSWKGEETNYNSMHAWVIKWKGNPDICEMCGVGGFTSHQIHWANIDHKYRRVLDDFIRLCVKCHWEYDKKNNGK